jgi:two-component system LytT family response regulator
MQSKFSVLIADDEPLARKGLRKMLTGVPDLEVVGESADGPQAAQDIGKKKPDLVFLDIQMPGLDGFGVIEKVGIPRMPVTIFVTAYDRHALRAFQMHAIDYLLKPIDKESLHIALDRARAILQKHDADNGRRQLATLLESLRSSSPFPSRFVIRSTGRTVIVNVKDIEWCEAEDDYVALYVRGKKMLLHETVGSLESKLDPRHFVRIHRSIIVPIQQIRELKPMFNGDQRIILRSGKDLPLSRTYRKRVLEALESP